MAFTEIPLTNQAYQKMIKAQPVELTLSFEGDGAGVAYLLPNWTIVIMITTAAEAAKYFAVTTPIPFRVTGMQMIHNNADTCKIQALNTAAAITDDVTVAASDTDIDDASEIDDAAYEFAIDDDDLRFEITTAAFLGIVIVKIAPILS